MLAAVGGTIVHVGPSGSRQTVKAANQLIVAGNIELLAEAVAFLEAYGVDTCRRRADGARWRPRRGRSSTRRARGCWRGLFQPGFRIDLHHKDLGIVTSAAREAGVVIPLGAVVAQLMASARANGDGGLDRSALLRGVLGCPAGIPRTLPPTPTPAPPDRSTPMPRMRSVDAAVAIMVREGVDVVFGLPGAAINPFYSAMRADGSIRHILARHVEGAAHMAEGYTRTAVGNIGVCVGTSGPAGTDMITGLYSRRPIPSRSCASPGRHRGAPARGGFQAVDIAAIAKPLTKLAMTVLEPAQVPGAFQQAFHLMRSGGPVLLDLPFDVQMAEIEFDPDTYEPLPAYKPRATPLQAAKVLDMLERSERPVIVAGGGIVNADAAPLLVELAEVLGVPVIPTLMGWGTIPDDRLMAGMAGLQTSPPWQRDDARRRLRPGHRQPLGQSAHRRSGRLPGGAHLLRRRRADPDRACLPAGTTASSPTPVPRWSCSSSSRRSGRRPWLRTARSGPANAATDDAPCCAAPTSTTSRSSRSGCMRR